jgi:cytochrome c-type biogenesis protein CcmH/NrfG
MTDFADRFHIRYSTLTGIWKALAEGETPEHFPVEWKSINYYAQVFSGDADETVKTAAQAFLREVEVARLDAPTFAARLMLATQTFAQTICDQAGIPWQEARRAAMPAPPVRQAPKPSAKPKAGQRSPARTNTRRTRRST